MQRNSQNSETVYLKVVRNKKFRGERHSPGVTRKTASVAAATRAVEASDLQTFVKVIDECRQMVKCTQHQVTLLAEQNASLQKELIALTQKEAQARHLAHHDGLTGLPNRSLLHDRFHQAITHAERHHYLLGLLMLDLDKFKRVNDKLGHASGDKLLQAVAMRLAKSIRGADTACRFGGDEFIIMLPVIDSPNIATALAEEISGRLNQPYIIDGHKIHMAVSVGVAVYPGDGQTFDELLKQADVAMYRTKGTGDGTSITELPREDTAQAEIHNPLAANNAGRIRESDLFTQH
jgi:diguanylate cyclase (GGDEF)-like protein